MTNIQMNTGRVGPAYLSFLSLDTLALYTDISWAQGFYYYKIYGFIPTWDLQLVDSLNINL